MALYQNKPFQKGHGLFSTEEIPVLDLLPRTFLISSLALLLLLCPCYLPFGPLHTSPILQNPVQQRQRAGLITSKGPPTQQEKYFLGGKSPVEKEGPSRDTSHCHGQSSSRWLPFTTSDLCNRKIHSKGLREDPEGFLNLLRGLFQTHVSTKADTQSLQKLLQMGE